MKTQASNATTEVVAGITTFFTMSYIVVVNPAILSDGTGMEFNGVLTATVLVCFISTLLMGMYAKLPYAVAPGMGLNAFFTYSLILGKGIAWQQALSLVFWSGIIFLLLSVTPVREKLVKAIPKSIRLAAGVGIGLFLIRIGLQNGGLIAANPAVILSNSKIGSEGIVCIVGLISALILYRFVKPIAFLLTIAVGTATALVLDVITSDDMITIPASLLSTPDFSSVFFQIDWFGAFQWAFIPPLIAILFTDLFDSISTFMGVAHATNFLDENGNPRNLREGLIVDAISTTISGPLGSSSGTTYIESAAGIEAGGRTGLTAIVAALCFLPCLFIAPLAGMIPSAATAPVLIVVGALMFKGVQGIDWDRFEEFIPAVLVIVLIPLMFSLTQGILVGFILHPLLFCFAGRIREVNPIMIALAVISVCLIAVENFT